MVDPKLLTKHNWIKEVRGLPSIQAYNLLNDTKTAMVNANHLDDVTADKLAKHTGKLKQNIKEMESMVLENVDKIDQSLDRLSWLSKIA